MKTCPTAITGSYPFFVKLFETNGATRGMLLHKVNCWLTPPLNQLPGPSMHSAGIHSRHIHPIGLRNEIPRHYEPVAFEEIHDRRQEHINCNRDEKYRARRTGTRRHAVELRVRDVEILFIPVGSDRCQPAVGWFATGIVVGMPGDERVGGRKEQKIPWKQIFDAQHDLKCKGSFAVLLRTEWSLLRELVLKSNTLTNEMT